jgi:hypothetical protein
MTEPFHGSSREAQTYLNTKLQERDIGRPRRATANSMAIWTDVNP